MGNMIVYFDESGYTGENLLNERQPTFSYATVNIEPDRAEELVHYILGKYPENTQSEELKATTLLKKAKGKDAVLEILDEIKNNIKISVSDKKYALAAKFFEYMIEPIIASKNSIFYNLNFHKYISTVLYISFITNDGLAIELFSRFEQLIRAKTLESLNNMISLIDIEFSESESTNFIKRLLLLIKIHQVIIYDEIKDLPKWTADLSITALNSLFSELGKNGDILLAYCDKSKPILEQEDIFENMIGRTDIIFHPLFTNNSEPIAITYNLKELNLVDSKEYYGIQLADVVAGTASYVFEMYKNAEDDFSKQAKAILIPNLVYGSIFPDFNEMDLSRIEVQLNAILFDNIVERSIEKIDILEGIEDFISYINNKLVKSSFPL